MSDDDLPDDFLEHAVKTGSQYSPLFRRLCAQLLAARRLIPVAPAVTVRYYAKRHEDDDVAEVELSADPSIPEGFRLLYFLDAATWEEAMAVHHLRQGFEPYRPEGAAVECPRCASNFYPFGSGACWRCGQDLRPG